MEKKTGKMVVIRGYLSGVWHGELAGKTASEITLKNARRLWSWTGALSVSEIAVNGVTGGKISPPTNVVLLRSDCVEIHEAKVALGSV